MMMLASAVAFSDIARPEPKPQKTPKVLYNSTADMTIKLDRDAKQPVLRIPNSAIKDLRAELEREEGSSDDNAAVNTNGGVSLSRTQTIMSGAFLSLALIFGGFWFIRSGKAASKGVRNLVILGVVSAVALTATFVYANIGPPPFSGFTNRLFNRNAMVGGTYAHESGIRIERTNGTEIELIIPDFQPAAPAKSVKISPSNSE